MPNSQSLTFSPTASLCVPGGELVLLLLLFLMLFVVVVVVVVVVVLSSCVDGKEEGSEEGGKINRWTDKIIITHK